MLSLRGAGNQRLRQDNLVQKSYRVQYKKKEGHLLVSQNKIRVIEEKGGSRTSYNKVLEIPYEKIAALTVESRHRLTLVDKDDRKHSLILREDVIAYTFEADLKRRIAPLDYHQLG
jgi:hypothetical protein